MTEQTLYAVALSEIKGIGPVYFKKLLENFKTPKNAFNASYTELEKIVPSKIAERIKDYDINLAERILNIAQRQSIEITYLGDDNYPKRLININLPPPVIYYRGNLQQIDDIRAVGIVGTRKPTQYGARVASMFSRKLAEGGVGIVSGGAYGIDTIALKTGAENNTYTVAVLGNGLLNPYPSSNRELFKKIIKTGGAVISEFSPEERPKKENFPKRNRIISGLSDMLLVVEAGEKSGSLITAAWATEQNVDVYAVPGPITSDTSRGTNLLIKEGANIALNPEILLKDLGISETTTSKIIELTKEEKVVYDTIGNEPIHADRLSEILEIEIFKLTPILFSLELKGAIRQLPGKYYVREGLS